MLTRRSGLVAAILVAAACVTFAQAPVPVAASAEAAALDGYVMAARTVGYVPAAEFITFIKDAEAGVRQAGLFDGRGLLAVLAIVFVGGLALNLTPCVLPMIPLNLAIIGAGSQASSRRRGFLLGGTYGAAMALVYGLLGVVVVLTAGSFGSINASPWFNVAMAGVFVVLGLAMFDVFHIDFSRWSSGIRLAQQRGSLLLAFGMGGVVALLAGACVAPVVLQVSLFSSKLYAEGSTAALALPFLLGIGMAAPWPFAGAGLAALPKPGAWMVRVKQAFGLLIFVMAGYYAYLGYGLLRSEATAPAGPQEGGWYASLADGMAAAKREGKPVLVDMWATWCKNCTVMDETTFTDESVRAAMAPYVLVKFQAEDPEAEPARTLMRQFDTVGLPTYVILEPR
jgi:thioredoxin:protein disulfide reductase